MNDYEFLFLFVFNWFFVEYFIHLLLFGLILSLFELIFIVIVGPKDLGTPAHFISSPRLMPRRKKCLRTNEEGPNCQKTLSRTILFSGNQDHRRRKRHATKGSLPERPKGKRKCNETVMRV